MSDAYATLAVIGGLYLLSLEVSFRSKVQPFAPTNLLGVALVLAVIGHLFNLYQIVQLSQTYHPVSVVLDLLLVGTVGVALNTVAHPSSGVLLPSQQQLENRILGHDTLDLTQTFRAFFGVAFVVFALLVAWHLSAIRLYEHKAELIQAAWPAYLIGWVLGLGAAAAGWFGKIRHYEAVRAVAVAAALLSALFLVLVVSFGLTYARPVGP